MYTFTVDIKEKISLLRLAYKGLDESELKEIAALTRCRDYPKDYVLCHEGEYEKVIYVIAKGGVIITQKLSEEDGERVLRISGKGDVVGEMGLIQKVPRSATVRTTSPCTMLEMEEGDFEAIISRTPSLTIALMRITLDRLRENDQTAIADLRKSNRVLRQIDRNKMEFIQVTAHELRTPLTVLKGYVNVLQSVLDTKENTNLEDILEGINHGAERMHSIVNTMLDITRIDAEDFQITTIPVPIKQILDKVVYRLSGAANERELTLTIQHDPKAPSINADPELIEKALYHLIINAIKYTPDGGEIFVKTRPSVLATNTKNVEIAIQDSGIGLDVEHHELVFEKFYQVAGVANHSSGKTTFKGGGSGLGLAIVSGIAKAHHGKVWVESSGYDEERCPGSIFYLQIPVS
jgi:signal transduction histidine kinase